MGVVFPIMRILTIFASMSKTTSPWRDILCLRLFRKRYRPPDGMGREYWGLVVRRYGNSMKTIRASANHWRIITYDDGRRELAYMRVGRAGRYPALYRGLLFPRMVDYGTFAHILTLELAF